MQTATTRPTKARKPAAVKLPHPESQQPNSRFFWLAAFQRHDAQLEAFNRIISRRGWLNKPVAERYAIISALTHLENERSRTLKEVVEAGLLLFAHPATTVFSKVPA